MIGSIRIINAVIYIPKFSICQPLSQVAKQIVPGGKKAVLILDNGEAIDLKSTSGVELKEKDGTVIQVDSTALNYQQAPARTSEKLAYNKVNVPRGGESVSYTHLDVYKRRLPICCSGDWNTFKFRTRITLRILPHWVEGYFHLLVRRYWVIPIFLPELFRQNMEMRYLVCLI